MTKILVIGARGQLGTDMMSVLGTAGYEAEGIDVPAIDITDSDSADRAIAQAAPEVIVNCAAFTAVDLCESRGRDAFAVNGDGVANIARAARKAGAKVIHFSTDYVFDGTKNEPYIETDPTGPASVYGKSKLEGERRLAEILDDHIILRVAWLYGIHGSHFIKKIRQRALQIRGTREVLKVVTDEIGTPTYSVDVCRQTLKLLPSGLRGIFHCTNEGFCSRFQFAQEILRAYGLDVPITPCTSRDFILPAPRPAYSVLENRRLKELGINCMPDWKAAFGEYIREESLFTQIQGPSA